jgi:hypothetical protein
MEIENNIYINNMRRIAIDGYWMKEIRKGRDDNNT